MGKAISAAQTHSDGARLSDDRERKRGGGDHTRSAGFRFHLLYADSWVFRRIIAFSTCANSALHARALFSPAADRFCRMMAKASALLNRCFLRRAPTTMTITSSSR